MRDPRGSSASTGAFGVKWALEACAAMGFLGHDRSQKLQRNCLCQSLSGSWLASSLAPSLSVPAEGICADKAFIHSSR